VVAKLARFRPSCKTRVKARCKVSRKRGEQHVLLSARLPTTKGQTLLGNFVRTSCRQKWLQACKRRERTLGPRRESKLGALQHLTDANQIDSRGDGFGLQLRLGLPSTARTAQTMAANPFGKAAFDACPQGIALLKGRGALFRSATRARFRDGLRRKG